MTELTAKQLMILELTKKLIEQGQPDAADLAIQYAAKILAIDKPAIGFIPRSTRD